MSTDISEEILDMANTEANGNAVESNLALAATKVKLARAHVNGYRVLKNCGHTCAMNTTIMAARNTRREVDDTILLLTIVRDDLRIMQT